MSGIKIKERGWAGHFVGALSCRFRRNTLIEHEDTKIVVSTVGLYEPYPAMSENTNIKKRFHKIGVDRYYETMVFHANKKDKRYYDADVTREIHLQGQWSINEIDADDKANNMHENAVTEICIRIKAGEF